MRRWSLKIASGALSSVLLMAGCGDDPFGPPARHKQEAPATPAESVRTVFFITAGVPTDEVLAWGQEAQKEANLSHVIFRAMGPGPDETAAAQPGVIRKALVEGANSLLVVPGDSPDLGKALAEAEASGVFVALLGRSIQAPEGSKPFLVIEHGNLDPFARRIVDAALEDLRKNGRSTEGTALVFANRTTDLSSSRRVESLKKAATAAGFTKVVEVAIEGSKADVARKQVEEAVKANPDVAVILTDDAETMSFAAEARDEMIGKLAITVGGYVEFAMNRVTPPATRVSCYSQGRFEQLAIQGIRTLVSKMKGEPVGDRVFVDPVFHRVELGNLQKLPTERKKSPVLQNAFGAGTIKSPPETQPNADEPKR